MNNFTLTGNTMVLVGGLLGGFDAVNTAISISEKDSTNTVVQKVTLTAIGMTLYVLCMNYLMRN